MFKKNIPTLYLPFTVCLPVIGGAKPLTVHTLSPTDHSKPKAGLPVASLFDLFQTLASPACCNA